MYVFFHYPGEPKLHFTSGNPKSILLYNAPLPAAIPSISPHSSHPLEITPNRFCGEIDLALDFFVFFSCVTFLYRRKNDKKKSSVNERNKITFIYTCMQNPYMCTVYTERKWQIPAPGRKIMALPSRKKTIQNCWRITI